MRTQYQVKRHYNVIFTGSLTQVKQFLIDSGEFDYYKKQVKRCKYGDSRSYGTARYRRSLNFYCGLTEYCVVRPVDRRKKGNA